MADETLENLWQHVLAHWDDDQAHQVFLQHCQRAEQLGDAAGRYAVMRRDAVKGPSAAKRLETVATLAAAALRASRDPRPGGHGRWSVVLGAVVLGLFAAFVLLRAMLL